MGEHLVGRCVLGGLPFKGGLDSAGPRDGELGLGQIRPGILVDLDVDFDLAVQK
jgi:hypothetical protein